MHEEDDGPGGNGVDLYIGYLASDALGGKGGTTPVSGGMTKSNGGQPRNAHEVAQELFTLTVPKRYVALAQLHLIESDQTTTLVQQAFAAAEIPKFSTVAPIQVSAADVQMFYLVPFGPIIKLLSGSNTDDDYGHWNFVFSQSNGSVSCSVSGDGKYSHASPSTLVIPERGSASLTLRYVDGDNDIDCVIDLEQSTDMTKVRRTSEQ